MLEVLKHTKQERRMKCIFFFEEWDAWIAALRHDDGDYQCMSDVRFFFFGEFGNSAFRPASRKERRRQKHFRMCSFLVNEIRLLRRHKNMSTCTNGLLPSAQVHTR